MMGPMNAAMREEMARIVRRDAREIAPGVLKEDFIKAAEHVDMDELLAAIAQVQGTPISKMPEAAGVRM